MDIRQKTDTLIVGGKTYTITCNFNVMADVQAQYGGNLVAALREATTKPLHTALVFAAAMVNDAADAAGETERFTPAELGRALPAAMPGVFADRIMALVWAALEIGGEKKAEPADETPASEENEKN